MVPGSFYANKIMFPWPYLSRVRCKCQQKSLLGHFFLAKILTMYYSSLMPIKIRDLEKRLLKAGFVMSPGKGSHRHFCHPSGVKLTLSGQRGDDVKPYQLKEADAKIKLAGS